MYSKRSLFKEFIPENHFRGCLSTFFVFVGKPHNAISIFTYDQPYEHRYTHKHIYIVSAFKINLVNDFVVAFVFKKSYRCASGDTVVVVAAVNEMLQSMMSFLP